MNYETLRDRPQLARCGQALSATDQDQGTLPPKTLCCDAAPIFFNWNPYGQALSDATFFA